MKKRLFIVSNYMTLLFSLAAIKKNIEKAENHLMLLANFCKPEYFADMKVYSNEYNVFQSISILDDYENRDSGEIAFDKYAADVNVDTFDEVYATCYYDQAIKFMRFYNKADLYFLSNGLGSYITDMDDVQFFKRFKGFYYLKYFDKLIPTLISNYGILGIPVEKEFFIEEFKKIADKVNISSSVQKSVFLCTQNLFFNNKDFGPKQEFDEYRKIAEYFIKQGYFVYLKDHPRTPKVFNIYMKHPQVISLSDYDTIPVEALIYKLKPDYVVSLFSTSLFNAKYLFDIDGFSFELAYPLRELHLLGHVMTKCYFTSIGASSNHLVKFDYLENQVMYQILLFAFAKEHYSEDKFLHLKNLLKNVSFSDLSCLKLKRQFFDLLKSGSYSEYLKWQN